MVASISSITTSHAEYFQDLSRSDYYDRGGEPPGVWIGKGSTKLSLKGQIADGDLEKVMNGFTPKGKPLVKNAGQETRKAGWDMTFSAPKSVSILWGISTPEVRMAVEEAHQQAVAETVDFLVADASWTRRGAQGAIVERAEPIVASYLHGTSRDMDPNLHTHCLFTNACIRKDGKTGAMLSRDLFRYKMAAGARYRCSLANKLKNQLNANLQTVRTWFEVKGIDKNVRDQFSKRRRAILDLVGPHASQQRLDEAVLTTRQVKKHLAQDLLISAWRKEAEALGLTQSEVAQMVNVTAELQVTDKQSQAKQASKAVEDAIAQIVESKSYFCRHDILQGTFERLQDGMVAPEVAEQEVDRSIESLMMLGRDKTREFYTTHELFNTEKVCLQMGDEMAASTRHAVSPALTNSILQPTTVAKAIRTVTATVDELFPETISKSFVRPDFSYLSDSQHKAVKYLTDRGSFKILSGRAGSGKTTVLAAAREAWERSGYKVVGTALSGQAAQELARGAGIESETVRMTLARLEPTAKKKRLHHFRQFLRAAKGQKTFKFDQLKLDRKTVLVIDEATMVGTRDMHDLLKHAHAAGAKVALVGDHRQLPSIAAGTPFNTMLKSTVGYELNDNVRQKTPWLRDATNLLTNGHRREALTKFSDEKRLRFSDSQAEAIEGLLHDWRTYRPKDLTDSICLANTNQEVEEINIRIQDERRQAGELGRSCIAWNGYSFRKGDRIVFRENDRKLQLWNGNLGTIKELDAKANVLTVELDSGRTIEINPKEYGKQGKLELGYAVTVHRAQGITVDVSFVLLGDGALTSSESSYVALTRARYDTFINVDGLPRDYEAVGYHDNALKEVTKRIEKTVAKQLAHDVQKQEQTQ